VPRPTGKFLAGARLGMLERAKSPKPRQRLMQREAVAPRQVQETDQAGVSLHERADRRRLVFADDQISLLVSGLRTDRQRERPVVDGQHRLLRPRLSPLHSPVIAAGPQRRTVMLRERRGPHQHRPGLVAGLTNALVT